MSPNSEKNVQESVFLENMRNRSVMFKRNDDLDLLLAELSQLLAPVESEVEKRFNLPSLPPLFLVGNPRSGTTLFMQFLSATKRFAVPTNLLSRFYYAPYLGSKIQQILTDSRFNYKNELEELIECANFTSSLGKTSGTLAPSEFNHFWRRFLPNYDPEYLNEDHYYLIDKEGLRKGVAAIENVFDKPFAAKGAFFQYNLELLHEIFNNALIVYLERNPLFVMQSILLARENFYNNRDIWWSVKPKEYEMLKDLDVFHQIAGQTYFTKKSIENELKLIPASNCLTLTYDTLCVEPESVYLKLVEKYAGLGVELNKEYVGPVLFNNTDQMRISLSDMNRLKKAYSYFECNW